ncbi:MAG: M42 family metallopeptidase [Lachnospiraceae bacterium]|nr:M42 family metallopeptidase [Lachnospiraceae bacterium]
MEYSIDNQFMLSCLEELINTPSPVSYYEEINPVIEKYAAMFGYPVTYDRKHTAYITLEGEDNSKTVMVGGHLDTLGMIVRRIDDDGCLRVRQLGGVNFYSMDGETVHVVTRDGKKYSGLMVCQSHSTHVFDDARSLERGELTMVISLDEDVHSREDVLALGIQHGDLVYAEPHFQYTEKGFIKSRFLDDKAAVAAMFGMLKFLTENHLKPKYRTLLAFPHYEEIGHGGAYLPPEVEEFVAVDIGLIGPDYDGNEHSVSICCKDFHTPYDRELTTRLINQAKKAGCDYAVDIFYRYGTDGSAALKCGNNVYAAAFGMAVYGSHGVERTHIDGIQNTAKLITAYVLDI